MDSAPRTRDAGGGPRRGQARGKLTLLGQTRDLTFRYAAAGGRGRMNVNGSFRVRMTDYGIEVPSYIGVKFKPGVGVTASFSTKDE